MKKVNVRLRSHNLQRDKGSLSCLFGDTNCQERRTLSLLNLIFRASVMNVDSTRHLMQMSCINIMKLQL